MLKKIASLLALVVLSAWMSPIAIAKTDFVPDIPEKDGVYEVPGHPGMKVRVFVHKQKPAKPAPLPTSELKCTLNDPGSEARVDGAGWVIPAGIWKYRVNTTVPATIINNLGVIVSNSFATWTNMPDLKNSGVKLQNDGITLVNRATLDNQNIIAWGRASGSALGVTYIWYQDGKAIELDTVMNLKFSWRWSNQAPACAWTNAYDAQNILTHELGHWFGLDDHYTETYMDNTMYGYGSTWEVKKDTLTDGDIAGIEAIY